MKQILQNLKNGNTEIADVPRPNVGHGSLLIKTSRTLVSAGTERMLVDFGKANMIDKARQQPDKVRMVLDKIKTDGLMPTIETVRNKLDQPLPLGYCNVGKVSELGAGVTGFEIGDRVASNGKHAEFVSVPVNLCAKVPDIVSDDEAAYTVIGAIALQGIRLVQPSLGETVVVIGLGLIGLMTVQLLRAHGCHVVGVDFEPTKLELARKFGAKIVDLSKGEDPVSAAMTHSKGRGVDAVILTASTKSNEPVKQAANMCRKRGRIVLVGVTGLELSRADFYEKELSFQVSCSYGPGRYDPGYEDQGNDYPIGFVRWTQQRNFEAVLDMMADGKLDIKSLISHRFDIDDAQDAYEIVSGSEPSLGILLNFPNALEKENSSTHQTVTINPAKAVRLGKCRVSFIGSGNYASSVLIPAFKSASATLKSVASQNGVSGLHAGRKHGFIETTTNTNAIFEDPETDAIVISTRHDSHADYVTQSLEASKHVFVEKPLCLTFEELEKIEALYRAQDNNERPSLVMVGFNRRFAPQVVKIKELLSSVSGPKSFVMNVNAGAIPSEHWTQDRQIGGGRIIGEACHFIDLLRYLAACPVKTCTRSVMDSSNQDTLSLQMSFTDGSIGTIHYFANGPKSLPKERLEVFASGSVLQLDNFRKLKGYDWPGFKKMNLSRQDKGQKACAAAFVKAIKDGGVSPIPFEDILEVSRLSIEMA